MKRFPFIAAAAILVASCSGTGFDDYPDGSFDVVAPSHGMIVLGERLEDPYSTTNITKALESLYPSKARRVRIDTTDLYVRFLPQNEIQYDYLESLGLELLDHPMDHRIVKEGDYYLDPEIPEGEITWQYSVVNRDFEFPAGIRYEILDYCYLSEHAATKADGIDWDAVEMESFKLTGNSEFLEPAGKAGDVPEAVAPSGRIAIMDEKYDSEPVGVAGVKVTCNSFVKICSAYTDDQGYYDLKRKYSSNIRYRLVFKNVKGFAIGLNLLLVPASVSSLGKNSPEGVSIVVDKDSDRKLFERCVANNAGYDYYQYCSEKGSSIKTPPANTRLWILHNLSSSISPMMQQGVLIDDTVVGEYLGEYTSIVKLFLPDIVIGLKDTEWTYDAIYSDVIHQFAHASHFCQAGKGFWSEYAGTLLRAFITSGRIAYGTGIEDDCGYIEVAEMWAYFVQTSLYRERYPDSDVSFGLNYWFFPHIFLALSERGMDKSKIFAALTSDITGRDILREKLLSLYPEYKSEITQAFIRYY